MDVNDPRLDGARMVHEAERAVLGTLLLMPEDLADVRPLLATADFLDTRHALIYAAMLRLADEQRGLDLLTLSDELGDDMPRVDGFAYLSSLDSDVPSSGNVLNYAEIVRGASVRRSLRLAGIRLSKDVLDENIAIDDVTSAVHAALSAAESRGAQPDTRFSTHLRALWNTLEWRSQNPGITGLPSGLDDLDELTCGFQPGDLVILGARPSMGKSALSFQIADYAASDLQKNVAVFSFEMGTQAVAERVLFSRARIDSRAARTGRFGGADWPKMAGAADKLGKSKLHIDYAGGKGIDHIRSTSRRIARKHGPLSLVVVDYLQLMKVRSDRINRSEAVGELSSGLKALAGELGCPVIALSQLNRELEKRGDKRPIMSDLRDSGNVEQDADVIVFLYRDEVYDKESKNKEICEIIVSKQRNGPTGTARVKFTKEHTRFDSLAYNDPRRQGSGE